MKVTCEFYRIRGDVVEGGTSRILRNASLFVTAVGKPPT
jgi:hypothetical protein